MTIETKTFLIVLMLYNNNNNNNNIWSINIYKYAALIQYNIDIYVFILYKMEKNLAITYI